MKDLVLSPKMLQFFELLDDDMLGVIVRALLLEASGEEFEFTNQTTQLLYKLLKEKIMFLLPYEEDEE